MRIAHLVQYMMNRLVKVQVIVMLDMVRLQMVVQVRPARDMMRHYAERMLLIIVRMLTHFVIHLLLNCLSVIARPCLKLRRLG